MKISIIVQRSQIDITKKSQTQPNYNIRRMKQIWFNNNSSAIREIDFCNNGSIIEIRQVDVDTESKNHGEEFVYNSWFKMFRPQMKGKISIESSHDHDAIKDKSLNQFLKS